MKKNNNIIYMSAAANPQPQPQNLFADPFQEMGQAIRSINDRVINLQRQRGQNKQQIVVALQAVLNNITTLSRSPQFQDLLQNRQRLAAMAQQIADLQRQLQEVTQQLEQTTGQRDQALAENQRLQELQRDITTRIGQITRHLVQELDKFNVLADAGSNADIEAKIREITDALQLVIDAVNRQGQGQGQGARRGGKRKTQRKQRQRQRQRGKKHSLRGGYVYKNSNATLENDSVEISTNTADFGSSSSRSVSKKTKPSKSRRHHKSRK